MKHPVWLINSSLALLSIITMLFIVVWRPKTPRWVSLEPDVGIPMEHAPAVTIDDQFMSVIYENDLFSTYQRPVTPTRPIDKGLVLPQPPRPRPLTAPHVTPPQFLEPLPIDLKGIITTGDEQHNRAIIQDTKTKVEKNYKIGDKIDDAQLIRIVKNRVIFIRANGQQETVYLKQKDAQYGPAAEQAGRFKLVVTQAPDGTYLIDPAGFGQHIHNLAFFIDMLDLTTVFKKGESIGCRIGTYDTDSLASYLGLQPGDMITSVNEIPATTTEKRYEIYQDVTAKQLGDTITIELVRRGRPMRLVYKLQSLATPLTAHELPPAERPMPAPSQREIDEHKRRVLESKHTFAPTLEKIKKREKRTILDRVRREGEAQQAQERPVRLDL